MRNLNLLTDIEPSNRVNIIIDQATPASRQKVLACLKQAAAIGGPCPLVVLGTTTTCSKATFGIEDGTVPCIIVQDAWGLADAWPIGTGNEFWTMSPIKDRIPAANASLNASNATSRVASQASSGALPVSVGECVHTMIKAITTRLEGAPDSGSAVEFTNDAYQVSYETIPAIQASRTGDSVAMCLSSIPKDCPPGDDRGREYKTTNLRTGDVWTLPDSEHMCGGA